MYIWTGLIFDSKDENHIRKICKELNLKYKLNEQSFSLPQHISLKMSFETSNDKEIIKYIKSILDSQSKMNLKITGISKINNAVIWLNIEETEELRKIHNLLNEKLQEEYSIPLKQFDGENFRFHSTLFQDEKICDEHELLLRELNYKLNFPIEIKINEINFGISEKGEVGTFTVIDKLNLK